MKREKIEEIIKISKIIDQRLRDKDELENAKKILGYNGDDPWKYADCRGKYNLILRLIEKTPALLDVFIPAFMQVLDKAIQEKDMQIDLLLDDLEKY